MSQRRIPPGFNINPDATTSDTYRRSARTFPIAASPNTPRQRTVRTYTAPPNSRWERGQAAETRRSAGSSMDLGTTEGVSRSVTTSTSASGSHVNSTSNTGPRCFRITGIPLSWSENDLFRALHDADASLTRQNFQPSLNLGCSGSTQTALLNLDPSTEHLQRCKYLQVPQPDSRVAVLLSIDNQFYYLTPLNNPGGEVVAELVVTNPH
jgi:hypothetical protein